MSTYSGCSTHAGDPLQDNVGGVRAEVIAQVKSSVRFRGMADFQYVSCDTRSQAEQVPGPYTRLHSLAVSPCNGKDENGAGSHHYDCCLTAYSSARAAGHGQQDCLLQL